MSFRRYENYRRPEVEWIPALPAHWRVESIKRTAYLKGRVGWKGLSSDEYLDKGYAYLVTGTDFRDGKVNWSECHYVEKDRFEDDPYIQLRDGDLLITKDGTIGKLAVVTDLNRPACLNSGIFLVRPLASWSAGFLYWVLSSDVFNHFIELSSFGSTIQHLYQNVFEEFIFPVPPSDEQHLIAAFLTREAAKIDALVEEQRRLIELLKEKRQAVISHAVTKGLGPSAPMKDSGVEWLGVVPAHWDIAPLKRYLALLTSGPRGWSELLSDHGPIFFQSQNIGRQMEPVFAGANRVQPPDDAEAERARLRDDDVVVCITGGRTGAVAHITAVPEPAYVNQHVCILRSDPKSILGRFLAYVLISAPGARQLAEGAYGLKQGLGLDDLRNVVAAVPGLAAQAEIVEYLDCETDRIDKLMLEADSAIAILQERRAALISAAVTGRIDVRERLGEREAA